MGGVRSAAGAARQQVSQIGKVSCLQRMGAVNQRGHGELGATAAAVLLRIRLKTSDWLRPKDKHEL